MPCTEPLFEFLMFSPLTLFICSCSQPQEAEAQGGAAPEVDLSKKHPLEHTWTLWFDNPSGKQKQTYWGQTLRSVYTFSTVEDFWRCEPSRRLHNEQWRKTAPYDHPFFPFSSGVAQPVQQHIAAEQADARDRLPPLQGGD